MTSSTFEFDRILSQQRKIRNKHGVELGGTFFRIIQNYPVLHDKKE